MNQQFRQFPKSETALRVGALVLALSAMTAGNAGAMSMFGLVPKPLKADAVDVSRGTSSPRAIVQRWHHESVGRSSVVSAATKVVARDQRCDVRDTCSTLPIAVAPAAAQALVRDERCDVRDTCSTLPIAVTAAPDRLALRDQRCDVRDTCSMGPVGAIESGQAAIRAEVESASVVR